VQEMPYKQTAKLAAFLFYTQHLCFHSRYPLPTAELRLSLR